MLLVLGCSDISITMTPSFVSFSNIGNDSCLSEYLPTVSAELVGSVCVCLCEQTKVQVKKDWEADVMESCQLGSERYAYSGQSLLPLKDCCSEPVLDLVLVLHMQFAVQEQKQFVSNLFCMPATVFSGLKIIHVLVTAWLDCCSVFYLFLPLKMFYRPPWSNMWPKGCLWPTGSLWLPLQKPGHSLLL